MAEQHPSAGFAAAVRVPRPQKRQSLSRSKVRSAALGAKDVKHCRCTSCGPWIASTSREQTMTHLIRRGTLLAIIYMTVPAFWTNAKAEPSWSRKYNAKCTLCHTVYPRLNRTGYEFKRLGYRLPSEFEPRQTASPANGAELSHSTRVVEPTGNKPKPSSSESKKGQELYAAQTCASCHSIGDQGGRIGPPLDGVSARRSPEFLTNHLAASRAAISCLCAVLAASEQFALIGSLRGTAGQNPSCVATRGGSCRTAGAIARLTAARNSGNDRPVRINTSARSVGDNSFPDAVSATSPCQSCSA